MEDITIKLKDVRKQGGMAEGEQQVLYATKR